MNLINKNEIINREIAGAGLDLSEKIGHTDDFHDNTKEKVTVKEWFSDNIPFIETPDDELNRVYYFRWINLFYALAKRKKDGKYEFCESAPGSYYHQFIDCAAGAHIRDARWIKNKKYLNDYIDIMPNTAKYREFITDSVWQKFLVDKDTEFIASQYEKLKSRLFSLNYLFDESYGLYHTTNNLEGQECGVNGFERLEKMLRYSASYTSNGDSANNLSNYSCEDKIWSCRGSNNEFDYLEISSGIKELSFTGFKIWFCDDASVNLKKPTSVRFYQKNGTDYSEIKTIKAESLPYPKGAIKYSFESIKVKTVKIVFNNDCNYDLYTGISLLVPEYVIEPWGCKPWWIVTDGYESFRVATNSYEAAALNSLSKMALLLGKKTEAEDFYGKYKNLNRSIIEKLWNDKYNFFTERISSGKRHIRGKENSGFSPWAFSLVPDEERFNRAFKYMMDKDVFLCEYGITSLEKNNPHYMQSFNHQCLWNGPVWPYTFSLALTALAKHLQESKKPQITKEDYYCLVSKYLKLHYDNNSKTELAIRENHHPDENLWLAQSPYYNHSTFIDNILSGVFGIIPKENKISIIPLIPDSWDYFCVENINIRSKNYSLIYDKKGTKYKIGKGIFVYCNNELTVHSKTIENIDIPLEIRSDFDEF